MKFAIYMAVSFITFLHIPLLLFCIILYMVCFARFCLILQIAYSYCYVLLLLCVYMFRSGYSVSSCCSCVNVYCTVLLPPGANPIAVNKHFILYHSIVFTRAHNTCVSRSDGSTPHVPIVYYLF